MIRRRLNDDEISTLHRLPRRRREALGYLVLLFIWLVALAAVGACLAVWLRKLR